MEANRILAGCVALALALGISGTGWAADSPSPGELLKEAAGQAAKDTLDKTLGSGKDQTRPRVADPDQDSGSSYENRRDGRGEQDNPGQGKAKKDKKDKKDKKRGKDKD